MNAELGHDHQGMDDGKYMYEAQRTTQNRNLKH